MPLRGTETVRSGPPSSLLQFIIVPQEISTPAGVLQGCRPCKTPTEFRSASPPPSIVSNEQRQLQTRRLKPRSLRLPGAGTNSPDAGAKCQKLKRPEHH
jgi:hypothetical protein